VEDILVKMIRLIANLSISADVGQQLACTDSLVELLIHIIGMCQLCLSMFFSMRLGSCKIGPICFLACWRDDLKQALVLLVLVLHI